MYKEFDSQTLSKIIQSAKLHVCSKDVCIACTKVITSVVNLISNQMLVVQNPTTIVLRTTFMLRLTAISSISTIPAAAATCVFVELNSS